MHLTSAHGVISLDDLEEHIQRLFEELRVAAPEYGKIIQAFYSDPTLSPPQVVQLRAELSELHARYERQRMAEVKRERHVFSRDPQVEERILRGLLTSDVLLEKLAALVAFCEAAVEAHDSIFCHSD